MCNPIRPSTGTDSPSRHEGPYLAVQCTYILGFSHMSPCISFLFQIECNHGYILSETMTRDGHGRGSISVGKERTDECITDRSSTRGTDTRPGVLYALASGA